jgi:MFS family permease
MMTQRRALAAALALIIMTSNSTATSAVFVAYRTHWGLTPADIGLAFAVYVGTLIPVLLLFGGVSERYGRRNVIIGGMLLMVAGTGILLFAHGLPPLIIARLFQGAGAALGVGAISATFTESFKGRIAPGQALAVATAIALAFGPVITAIAYDMGGGPNYSYIPILVLGIAAFGLMPFFPGRVRVAAAASAPEPVLDAWTVWRGLRVAMPIVFIGWAANSLYLSLVPSYIAEAVHASDPLIGAGAFLATQLATVVASVAFGNVSAKRNGVAGSMIAVAALALLVVGTNAHNWTVIVIATILVGGGAGVASGAAYAITNTVGRGQRARIFARLLVSAYAGYSLPSLVIGIIATHSSFSLAFSTVITALALIALTLPFLQRGYSEGAAAEALVKAPSSTFAMCQHCDTGVAIGGVK